MRIPSPVPLRIKLLAVAGLLAAVGVVQAIPTNGAYEEIPFPDDVYPDGGTPMPPMIPPAALRRVAVKACSPSGRRRSSG